MSKLTIKLAYHEVNPLSKEFVDNEGELVEARVDLPDDSHDDLYIYIMDNFEEIDLEARKKIASRVVDYDSFGSDSAYLDRIDEVAECYYLEFLSIEGAKDFLFDVEGVYQDDQLWGETVSAINRDEARLHAKWIMASNSGVTPDPTRESPSKWLEHLFEAIDEMHIETIEGASPNTSQYQEVLRKIVIEVEGKGISLKAMTDIQILLLQEEEARKTTLMSGIEYLEQNDEASNLRM